MFKGTTVKVISQKGGFLGPLMKVGLPLMKNVLRQSAKNVLMPLGLTAAASAIDAAIQKKSLGLGMATLIMSNEERENIMP